ncbi:MAG: UDP-N-acetylmuramoyl-tripeptide--D-alanyl-D-alanine ligase [Bacteroidetes bacterium]|nr:UDP-N-acetylmuramoyl-tripeptide--D-alanyl-D-alanine ligase [Bacteroidota bacterium]
MQPDNLYKLFRQNGRVITDSRIKTESGIFFALKGERFNGNLFASQALKNGCKWAVVDEDVLPGDDRVIRVNDVMQSLQELANYHRRQRSIPLLAITGSNGKTTTKELIHSVLSKSYKTLATQGNLNNHIGVPLTLLSISDDHEFAIVEMGANHIGEIKRLCEIAEPTHGIITNIGKAHLEGFGSLEGVITAKTELYQFLHAHDGVVFFNASNEILSKEIMKYNFQKIAFDIVSTSGKADYLGVKTAADPFLHCRLFGPDQRENLEVKTQLTGAYNLENITAAFCIGSYFNVPVNGVAEAIQSYLPGNARSQIIETGKNRVLLDNYNANPTSMKLAIQEFINYPTDKKKAMILGDMRELGKYSYEEHQNIVHYIEKHSDIDVYFVGAQFGEHAHKNTFHTSDDLLVYLREHRLNDHFVLLKGSRSIGLEKIMDVL